MTIFSVGDRVEVTDNVPRGCSTTGVIEHIQVYEPDEDDFDEDDDPDLREEPETEYLVVFDEWPKNLTSPIKRWRYPWQLQLAPTGPEPYEEWFKA